MPTDFSPAVQVAGEVATNIADLIALSTHGQTGFADEFVGSIAEDLANYSVIRVLTYVSKRKTWPGHYRFTAVHAFLESFVSLKSPLSAFNAYFSRSISDRVLTPIFRNNSIGGHHP